MEVMAAVCREAGFPIELSKTVGQATAISFLGMELDTDKGIIRLPENKLRDVYFLSFECNELDRT